MSRRRCCAIRDFCRKLSLITGAPVHPQVSQSGSDDPRLSEGSATNQTQQALTAPVGSQVKDLSADAVG